MKRGRCRRMPTRRWSSPRACSPRGPRWAAVYRVLQGPSGKWLDGGKTYKLHVPANPPTKQFWSVSAYDENTRRMVITEQGRPDISSRKKDIMKNNDGSIGTFIRSQGAEGAGGELGADRSGQGLVRLFPILWTDRAVLRQDVETAGLRGGEVNELPRIHSYWPISKR